jgi:phenylacetate-CoA ligase
MSQKFWDEKFETMPANQMKAFQADCLKEQLKWAYDHVPFYKESFDKHGIKPAEFTTIEDLKKFPFTLKTDLAISYPYGMLAVPFNDLVRIHASSGTTGKPSPGFYTQHDLDQWTECMARGLWAQEVRPDSVFQNANGMGLFTGGLGFHQGALRIGAIILPTGTGMTERQLTLMQDFGTTALTCTASYCLTILERAEQLGIDMSKLKLKTGHFGAEPWSEEMRRDIEQRGQMKAYEHYGLTEMMGPGVAFNCENYRLHINEDHVYPEIIDPTTLEPLPPGEKGELVFTALKRKGMPLIRYRTRDICTMRKDMCECGRSLIMMDKVLGRSDDMIIISGVNVFPSQVESVLMQFEPVEPLYLIRLHRRGHRDYMSVETELKPSFYQEGAEQIAELEKRIAGKIKQIIGITVPVHILPRETILRSQGKAKRVMDERNLIK